MIEPLLIPVDSYLIPSLPTVWFGVVLFTVAMYVALDGFDFGIGMLYALREDDHERETMLAAFGPVWDANEVWLVAFGTTLLAAFPVVYSRLLSDHYLVAIGIVLALLFRGLGPELREQREDAQWQRACSGLFVVGSLLSPLFIGMLVGSWVFAAGTLSLPSILTGVGLIALSVTNGAAFLAAKTSGELRAAMRSYGIGATLAYLGGVVVLLAVVVATDAGGAAETILSIPGVAVVGLSVAVALGGIAAARTENDRLWFASTLALSGLLVALVALLLYPTVYPPGGLTIDDAVVSPLALNLTTVLGLPVLLVVLWYFKFLYGVFSGPIEPEGDGYGG
ncbi:cytochrome d ubiquinol oxidase subunit II [Halapricum salinum]|uniref:Cytochrome d ubiquinol oxidase subunit II n=1 Tax=Halapricum salinum TaxID=1457250 RepID=A0A4D6HCQ3_9EURY|nr:cytochrome d ubiquinol oxidase subunit II [Halapricum salinum]QCC51016.1 cytochrome d ubiquinol oxidase subunit II [Halapricum salinum]